MALTNEGEKVESGYRKEEFELTDMAAAACSSFCPLRVVEIGESVVRFHDRKLT